MSLSRFLMLETKLLIVISNFIPVVHLTSLGFNYSPLPATRVNGPNFYELIGNFFALSQWSIFYGTTTVYLHT